MNMREIQNGEKILQKKILTKESYKINYLERKWTNSLEKIAIKCYERYSEEGECKY